jgi:serine/threonine protein kinase
MTFSQNTTAPVREGDVLAAKYRIEKVIGVGGMGVVVSAMHLELDTRVALKFLLPQAATNEELVGRFVREAKASVKLKGEHVAKVLDVGRMDDGRAYIVMEHLDGRDLGAELKAHDDQFSVHEAVSWMLQACEGLAEAHALGIVHRDLKPGNLFLTRTSSGRRHVKVLDFGISKSINPNSSDMLSLTKTEMLLGSPLYMAPEQMRSSKYVDERSDIWALGAIAYELLTRRVPFEAETLLDLCFKVAQEGCPAVHEVRPEIPIELSDVVMRCLEKHPDGRWLDIGELAAALEPFAAAEDRGSAGRTIGILAAGTQARTRVTERSSDPGAEPADPRRTTGPNRIDPIRPRHISVSDHAITGTAATERATSDAPPAKEAANESSAPDAIPASSAWGTTNASEKGPDKEKKGRLGLFAVAGVVVVGVVGALLFARGGSSAKPDTATTGAVSSAAPLVADPSPPPSSSEPAVTKASPPPEESAKPTGSASAMPARTGTVVSPRPRASAPASATVAPPPASAKPPEPASSSGFIRIRE